MTDSNAKRGGVMAVASVGGHWEQLMMLRPMLQRNGALFVTTEPDLLAKAGIENGRIIPDCNRNQLWQSFLCLVKSFGLVLSRRPSVVISTGAAPGFFCLLAGRLIGARTVWIDSVANVEILSRSGQLARWVATDWLTQWEHLAKPEGPHFAGAVL